MIVREATVDDVPDVLNVLDGGALATEYDRVRAAVERDAVFVAEAANGDDGPVLGALVLDGEHVVAIAVRRRRRGQGIGTALVEAASERRDRLTASFDVDVRPFYRQLDFALEPADEDGRYRGVWTAE